MARSDDAVVDYYVNRLCSEGSPLPEPTDDDSDELKAKRAKRARDEYLAKGHLINSLSNSQYQAHRSITDVKELWNTLETKYNRRKRATASFW